MVLAVCMPGVHDRPRSLDWGRRFARVQLPPGTMVLHQYHYHVDRCRQLLAEEALRRGATHLLWWDDDCWPPEDGVLRLLRHRYPWCTGVYVDRNGLLALGMFREDLGPGRMLRPTVPPPPGRIGWADACGLGFCLMDAVLFRRLAPPWFRFEFHPDGHVGEDIYLSRRIRGELGIRVLVDGDVRIDQEEIVLHRPDGSRIPVWQAHAGVVQRA
jgi:hypothetical protein